GPAAARRGGGAGRARRSAGDPDPASGARRRRPGEPTARGGRARARGGRHRPARAAADPRRREARARRRGRAGAPGRSQHHPRAGAGAAPFGAARRGGRRAAPPPGPRRSHGARRRAPGRDRRGADQRRRGRARPPRPHAPGGAALMARDLRLFYFFRLLSTSYLFVPGSVADALSRGLSLVEVMLLNTVYCTVVIFTEVPTGAIADRVGRRATMMAGALAMVAACTVYALAHGFAWFAVAEALAALS